MRKILVVTQIVITLFGSSLVMADELLPKVMMPDVQLNDLTDLAYAPEEMARVALVSSTIKEKLAEQHVDIVPTPQSILDIQHTNSPTYLFDHYDHAAQLAKGSGAKYLIIGVALKPTYLFVYPRMKVIDIDTGEIVYKTYAQLESSWSDNNTTVRTAQNIAVKLAKKLNELNQKQ